MVEETAIGAYSEKTHIDHQIELTRAIRHEAARYHAATGCTSHSIVMALKEVKDEWEGTRNNENRYMV